MSFSQADLGNALAQCADYAKELPWESPDLLFALIPTALLGADLADGTALSPVLQDQEDPDLQDLPAEVVAGRALVTEITVVPPDGLESTGRRARLIAGVLRTGARLALLDVEPSPDDDPAQQNHLRTHPEMAADLLDELAATFDGD
ncbi:MAG: hypothetical protein QM809_08495 [Gordonia sp. (in: high G+C Gram-positive bacteria)]|uniref:hypothetical protein n=1 Tax=Gordonia sp. (in: high G+C Gram-positive bacteria) TaxID=84139 RepID=UPI0039E2D5CC